MVALAGMMAIMLAVFIPVTHAGWVGATGAAQTGSGLKKFLDKKVEAFSEIMSDAIQGDDISVFRKVDETLDRAAGEILTDTSFALSAVNDIARKAPETLRKVRTFAAKGIDNAARALAVSKGRREDDWSEEKAIGFHEKPLKRLKTAFVRKLPSARTGGHSGRAGESSNEEIYQSFFTGKPKELRDYRKYQKEAIANWERNATEKQKWFRKRTGAGPEVMNFHEYLQRQKSGGANSDALAGISAGGGYASAVGGLDEREEEQHRQRQRAEEERMRQEEERRRETARVEREAEQERTRQEEEQRRMDRLEQEQQQAIRQQAWQNIAESLNSFNQQMQNAYSNGGGSGAVESGEFRYCKNDAYGTCRQ